MVQNITQQSLHHSITHEQLRQLLDTIHYPHIQQIKVVPTNTAQTPAPYHITTTQFNDTTIQLLLYVLYQQIVNEQGAIVCVDTNTITQYESINSTCTNYTVEQINDQHYELQQLQYDIDTLNQQINTVQNGIQYADTVSDTLKQYTSVVNNLSIDTSVQSNPYKVRGDQVHREIQDLEITLEQQYEHDCIYIDSIHNNHINSLQSIIISPVHIRDYMEWDISLINAIIKLESIHTNMQTPSINESHDSLYTTVYNNYINYVEVELQYGYYNQLYQLVSTYIHTPNTIIDINQHSKYNQQFLHSGTAHLVQSLRTLCTIVVSNHTLQAKLQHQNTTMQIQQRKVSMVHNELHQIHNRHSNCVDLLRHNINVVMNLEYHLSTVLIMWNHISWNATIYKQIENTHNPIWPYCNQSNHTNTPHDVFRSHVLHTIHNGIQQLQHYTCIDHTYIQQYQSVYSTYQACTQQFNTLLQLYNSQFTAPVI